MTTLNDRLFVGANLRVLLSRGEQTFKKARPDLRTAALRGSR